MADKEISEGLIMGDRELRLVGLYAEMTDEPILDDFMEPQRQSRVNHLPYQVAKEVLGKDMEKPEEQRYPLFLWTGVGRMDGKKTAVART